ncbi:MAG: DUF115 domain-containing protein [Atopobiaceae bacterium]|nr:DUF115 domain-containing protein [Atopobiaceae bacterium]
MRDETTGISLHDKAVHLVAALKHNRLARIATMPVMSLQFMRRDFSYVKSEDSARVKALANQHAGERCFILGNGPSLSIEDLDLLKDEVTFASNRIYKLFDKTEWRPTYYVAVDREVIAQEADNLPGQPIGEAFINITPASKRIEGKPHITLINKRPKYYSSHKYTTDNIFFSREPWRCVSEGYTVTYTCFQLAFYMGFKEVYLLGMDHTYSHFVDRNGVLRVQDGVDDHCYDDPKGAVINPQYKEGVEFAYRVALYEGEDRGIRICNATRGGSLEIFERVDLESVLTKNGEGNE